MRVLLSGAAGLIGGEVRRRLQARGDEVIALSRAPHAGAIAWPEGAVLQPGEVEGFDAVIHLAGESVAGRWTATKKRSIYDSRIARTRTLCEALAKCQSPPHAFLCASAIGIYGNRGNEELDESSATGSGFLADVCRDWESATAPLQKTLPTQPVRIAHLRFGVVLDRRGGAFKAMLLPFKLGLGGKIGDGSQFMSWVTLDDVTRAVLYVLDGDANLSGAFNVTAPQPVSNIEFTRTLGRALHRPTLFLVPSFAVRLLFGEFADEGLLSSARVLPRRLLENGFVFEHESLPKAFAALLSTRS